jgi:integrase
VHLISADAHSEGIREAYAKKVRDEIIVNMRFGKSHPLLEKPKATNELIFSQLVELYFSYRLTKGNTEQNLQNINKDRSVYNTHLAYLANISLNKITLEVIEKLKLNKIKSKSQKTVNNILTLISAILNFAKEREIITDIPIINKIHGIDNARERYLSSDEIKLVLNRLSDNPILTIFVKISLSTGGRLETIRSIKVKDINFTENTVNLIDLKGQSFGKNNATYIGFINSNLASEILQYIHDNSLNQNSYLFTGNNIRISRDYISYHLQKIFNELFNYHFDLDDRKNRVVIHTLRHTFATQLAKVGTPIYTIQKLMNHSDIKMTARYTKFSPENGRNVVNNLKLY